MSRFNVGGTSQWLYQLSQGLDERQITNVLLIGDCPSGELEDSRLEILPHKKISGLGPKASIIQTIRAFFELRKEIERFKPDIVNTHTSKAGVLGRIATKTVRTNAKVAHTYHGHVLNGYFNPVIENLIKGIEIFLSFFTDLFLVSGEQVLLDLRKAHIIRNKPAKTIWPAVPDIQVNNGKLIRKEMGIPNDAIVFGWLGRKVPIKRVDRIIEMAISRPEYYFIIAGDGESIEKTYSSYFVNREITNLKEEGYTSPSVIWAVADICLLTSDNEAMPISPIEAAICSKPTLATDAGSTREVVIDGKTGFVSTSDSARLLSLADILASSSELRDKMGKEARNFAITKFSPGASIERQIYCYRSV